MPEYEDVPWLVRKDRRRRTRLRSEWASVAAEFGGSDSAAGIVHQLRQRAHRSRRTARWIFFLLLLVILVALIYYLGVTFLQDFVDGRRDTLKDRLTSIETTFGELDIEREGIRGDLVLALKGTVVRNPTGLGEYARGHILQDDKILLYGWNGAISRSTDGGKTFKPVRSGVEDYLTDHTILGKTILLYGDHGTITRSFDGGQSFKPVHSGIVDYIASHIIQGQNILLYGSGGEITRSTDGGRTFSQVSAMPAKIAGHILLGDTIFLYGSKGLITRSTDGGKTFTPVLSGLKEYLSGHAVSGEVILIYGSEGSVTRSANGGKTFKSVLSSMKGYIESHIIQGNTVLLYGPPGVVSRSTDGGQTFSLVPLSANDYITGHILLSNTILLYGSQGSISRSDDSGQTFVQVSSGVDQALAGHIVQGQTILLYGAKGVITRSTDGGKTFTPVRSGVKGLLSKHIVRGQEILLYGGRSSARITGPVPRFPNGSITRSIDGGQTFTPVPSGAQSDFYSHVSKDQATLLFGQNGVNYTISDKLSNDANALQIAKGTDGDTTLLAFIDETLPRHVNEPGAVKGVDEARRAVLAVLAKRDALIDLKKKVEAELLKLDDFPKSLLRLEDQRVAFEDFMTICRGTVEEADVTQVCAAAYQAELEAESGNWWQTLAQQVPPGILILFLLATLGGLYRYNLRLAGFHASRADLLELALIDPEMMRGKDGETLVTQLADALAADKVEFGKGNTPTDQAVAMAQAILNRK